MKILIVGGTGFIGKNLTEFLSGEHEVYAPSRNLLDLENKDSVDRFLKQKFDFVINASGYGIYGVEVPDQAERNIRMFLNLVDQDFGKMIHIGSGAEYDKSRPLVNVKEEEFGRIPKDKYGFTKYLMSRYIKYDDRIYCLRPFGLFGKYEDSTRRFVSNAICRVLSGQPILIYQNLTFDYLWINDFCRIVSNLIERLPSHRFMNVGSGNKTTLKEVAGIIGNIHGGAKTKVLDKIKGTEYTPNIDRLKASMDFEPATLKQSIHSLYHWYNKKR